MMLYLITDDNWKALAALVLPQSIATRQYCAAPLLWLGSTLLVSAPLPLHETLDRLRNLPSCGLLVV